MIINLNIIKYNKNIHFPILSKWYNDWNMESPDPDLFPEHTYIIDNTISASLYTPTSGKVCFLENIISNINCPTEIRQQALGALGDFCFNLAKELDYKMCIGFTQNKSVAKTSKDHDMIVSDYTWAILTKKLGDK